MTQFINDPRVASNTLEPTQTISDPTEDNTLEVLIQLKEAIETLIGTRGRQTTSAVTIGDLERLGIITVKGNNHIQNNFPFNPASDNGVGVLKYCDGVTEDFGAGEGWYTKKSTGWVFVG